jgi:hypothetical protein
LSLLADNILYAYHDVVKPQSMSLGLPDKDPNKDNVDMKVDENRTMTVLLGDNGKVVLLCLLATQLRVLRTLLW